MSVRSVLTNIGHFAEKLFSPQALRVEATVADMFLPGLSELINSTVDKVITVENTAIAAGHQSGSGTQKSALVLSMIEQEYNAFATQAGIPVVPEAKQKYIDAVVALLNSFPAPQASTSQSN